MVKEKRILSYFIGWLVIGFIICFLGVTNVFAETITPTTGFKSQLGTLMTDNTIYWNTSDNYNSNLYFGTGPQYADWGIPAYMRLVTITDVSTNYSYKISYNMTIFTPYSSTSTWDSTKIDNNYNLMVGDDLGVIKESKCTVSNTDVVNGNSGVYTTKSISCVITINQNQSNVWLSSGYFCKNCNLSSLESLGYVPQDSYVYITSPTLERFNDNSNIIIDQNQTIIDQNNKTNEELGNIKEQIQESNKETQEVIKDQFNDCHYSNNILNFSNLTSTYNGVNVIRKDGIITLSGIANNPGDIDLGTYTLEAGNYYQNLNGSEGHNAVSVIRSVENNKIILVGNGVFVLTETTTVRFGIYFNEKFNGTYIYKPMVNKGTTSLNWEPGGKEICSNRIDETNDKLDNLTGAITDSSSPNTGALENSAGWLPPGPLDSVLNLPLSLFNALTTNLNKSCNPINIPLPYVNKNITLPCINTLYEQIGINTFLSWIGVIVSGLMLYSYLLKLYKWIEDRISLNETHNVDSWGGL